MDPIDEFSPVVRFDRDEIEVGPELVVVERPLTVVAVGRPIQTLMSSPGLERELAVGFCLTQGIAPAGAALTAGPLETDRVEVAIAPAPSPDRLTALGPTSASGSPHPLPDDRWLTRLARRLVQCPIRVDLDVLIGLPQSMTRRQSQFAATGGTHAAALAEADGRLAVMAEDVGRHNALDKAVGTALLTGIDLTDKVLVLSGRTSVEMMLKAGRAGVACLVSVSAPTRLALDMARRLGMTYAGFARPGRVNVYTGFDRVTFRGRPLVAWIEG